MNHSPEREKELFQSNMHSITKDNALLYVGRLLERGAQLYADVPALICKNATISYKELYRRAVALSLILKEKGVKPGDRVLLFFENSIEFYIGYYGILHSGAVVAPLNIFLHERELLHIIHDADPALIIASSTLKERLAAAVAAPVITEYDMPTSLDDTQLASFAIHDRDPDELTALLYTSGTTGLPKGVMLSSRNIMTNTQQTLARIQPQAGDRVFGVLPLFHSFAQNVCVWLALFSGCTVIVVPHIDRRNILDHMRYKPTFFLGVPALYGMLCLLRTVPVDSVKIFVCGGDALPDRIRAAFLLLYGRRIAVGYGLTEASPVVAVALEDQAMPMGMIGRPLVGITCMLKDAQGQEVGHGHIGELVIKGDNIMLGYYKSPEATADVLKNGWLFTGDLAYMDGQGRLILTGRSKDLIKHKGFNIYPQEVENIISGHPNVIRVGVIGKPDAQTGEVPVAYVQLKQEEAAMEDALRDLCRKNLAAYKVPRDFICSSDPLPITATGKVDKKQLRCK